MGDLQALGATAVGVWLFWLTVAGLAVAGLATLAGVVLDCGRRR